MGPFGVVQLGRAMRFCPLNAHITRTVRVLYDWHPWASPGRRTVHSVHKAVSSGCCKPKRENDTIPAPDACLARWTQSISATGLPLEVPLWMFDRMMCSSARREHHPQVVITALADLQALLAEVTALVV